MNFWLKIILLIVLAFSTVALADGKKNEQKEIILPKIIIPAPKKESERKKIRATKQEKGPLHQALKKQTKIAIYSRQRIQINFVTIQNGSSFRL